MNNTSVRARGISERNRQRLGVLHRKVAGPFRVREAAESLSLKTERAQRFLAYLADKGWLTRVHRGLYVVVPLDAADPAKWREDPWVVASRVFPPFYIGGWSACEHWGFTDQIFRETVVLSSRRVRHRRVEIHGFPFRVKVIAPHRIFGTSAAWRGRTRVLVSDPARTIVDILDDPALGGGIRHVAEVLESYLTGDRRDDARLLEYAHSLGNRSVFKRLGYLLERLNIPARTLLDACAKGKSSGISLLDPASPPTGRVLRRWNLRINATVGLGAESF